MVEHIFILKLKHYKILKNKNANSDNVYKKVIPKLEFHLLHYVVIIGFRTSDAEQEGE